MRAHVTSNWSLESEEELSSCTSLGTTPLLHTQRSKKLSQLQELQYKKYGKAKKSLDLLFDFHALLTPHKLHGWRSYQLVIAAKGQCVKIAYDSSGVRLHDFQLHSVLHFSIKTSPPPPPKEGVDNKEALIIVSFFLLFAHLPTILRVQYTHTNMSSVYILLKDQRQGEISQEFGKRRKQQIHKM